MSMKKMLSVLLAGAMAISLAACGSKTPNPPEVTPNTPSGPSSASTPEGPTDDGVWRPFNEKGETIRTDRDATGENGMVASSNVYATMAGLEILEQGGNAVDAAIAVCYALGRGCGLYPGPGRTQCHRPGRRRLYDRPYRRRREPVYRLS